MRRVISWELLFVKHLISKFNKTSASSFYPSAVKRCPMSNECAQPRVVLLSRPFTSLFWMQFLGALNDNLLKNAFLIAVVFKSYSTFGLPQSAFGAFLGGLFVFPYIVFSGMAGEWSDRESKFGIARVIKWVEVGIISIACFGFFTHSSFTLSVCLFLMGVHSAFFGPVKYSLIPEVVRPDQLVLANAFVEAGTFLAILFGTLIGGILIPKQMGELLLSTLMLSVSLAGLRAAYSHTKNPNFALKSLLKLQSPWNSTLSLWSTAQRFPKAKTSLYLISSFWAVGGGVLSVFPSFCKEVLLLNENETSLFLAAFPIGVGLGSYLCAKAEKLCKRKSLVFWGSVGLGLFLFSVSPMNFSKSYYFFCLLFAAISSGFLTLPLYVSLQEDSAESDRSKVVAYNNLSNALAMVAMSVALMILSKFGLSSLQLIQFLAAFQLIGVSLWVHFRFPKKTP